MTQTVHKKVFYQFKCKMTKTWQMEKYIANLCNREKKKKKKKKLIAIMYLEYMNKLSYILILTQRYNRELPIEYRLRTLLQRCMHILKMAIFWFSLYAIFIKWSLIIITCYDKRCRIPPKVCSSMVLSHNKNVNFWHFMHV